MAGLAEILGFQSNPFLDWTRAHSNTLLGLGAGIASGTNIGQGVANGLQLAAQGKQQDTAAETARKEELQKQAQLNQTVEWMRANAPDLAGMVEAGMPVSEAWQTAMERMSPKQSDYTTEQKNWMFAQEHPEFQDFLTNKGGPAEMSLQPTWMQDQGGNWFVGAQTKDGRIVKLDVPEGMSVVPPAEVAGAKAGATVDAKTAAAARAALPGAEQMMEITNKAIAEVRNNAKGMNEWFGQWGPRGVYVNPGSEMGKFQAAASPTNAQAFMQARNMLKGGGQITDYEGRRAEDAISRMQAAIDKGDQDQYLRAVADFEQAVAEGYRKLVEAAQGGYSAGGAQMPAPAGGNRTSTGISYTVEP